MFSSASIAKYKTKRHASEFVGRLTRGSLESLLQRLSEPWESNGGFWEERKHLGLEMQ